MGKTTPAHAATSVCKLGTGPRCLSCIKSRGAAPVESRLSLASAGRRWSSMAALGQLQMCALQWDGPIIQLHRRAAEVTAATQVQLGQGETSEQITEESFCGETPMRKNEQKQLPSRSQGLIAESNELRDTWGKPKRVISPGWEEDRCPPCSWVQVEPWASRGAGAAVWQPGDTAGCGAVPALGWAGCGCRTSGQTRAASCGAEAEVCQVVAPGWPRCSWCPLRLKTEECSS